VAVITLDTNQLRGKGPDGALLHMLQKVAQQTGHELVLPEMVVEEYVAHYRHEVELAVKLVRDGVDELRRLIPRWSGEAAFVRAVEEDAERIRRDELGKLFRTHPTPSDAWREALVRESSRRPPAKTGWEEGKPGGGARDVVIWLTILDACQSSRQETYFVSRNSSDFGKDGSLRPELARELHDRLGQDAHLLQYCADVPMLMSRLGIENVPAPDAAAIGSAHSVLEAVGTALSGDDVPFEFLSGASYSVLNFVAGFKGAQDVRFRRLQGKVEAYRIDRDIWACARGSWEASANLWVLWKPELGPKTTGQNVRVDFTVTATVVMQLDHDGAIIAAEVTDRNRLVIVNVGETP
jgi:PIN domain